MKLPVTLTIMRWNRQGPRLLLALCIGVAAANPCLAEDDSTVPILDQSLRTLDIGFRDGVWATPYGFEACRRPCSSSSGPDHVLIKPDPALSYNHDFSFNIKESGPLSFKLSGNRLRMKVEF